MAACQHCSATESACQWRDGCCEYCNHIEGRDLNATDPAVTEAMVARELWNTADDYGNPEDYVEQARALIHSLRPIIEAEVRERIAADIEAEAARRTARIISPYDRAHRDGLLSAERIARGQS